MQLAYRTARKKIRPPFSVLLWAGVGTRLQYQRSSLCLLMMNYRCATGLKVA